MSTNLTDDGVQTITNKTIDVSLNTLLNLPTGGASFYRVTTLPTILEANSIYFVELGSSYLMYVTSETGIITSSPITLEQIDNDLDINGYLGVTSDTAGGIAQFTRETTGSTDTSYGTFSIKTKKSTDMADFFGTAFQFKVEDDTSGEITLGNIKMYRNGADNSGEMAFATSENGVSRNAMILRANGNIEFGGNIDMEDVNTIKNVIDPIDDQDVVNKRFLEEYASTSEQATSIASGSTLGLEQALLANAGQPALTVLAVGYTTTGKVQGVSLGDGNVIEVYASGADYNAGIVLYREFMSLGEPICFTGIPIGAIITSTQGFYGACECVNGNLESDMPLLSYGLSFDFTFLFGFRSFGSATVLNQGLIHVVNGPLSNVIKLTDGSGNTIDGQEDIALEPWEYVELHGDGVKEYILEGTNKMMACTNATMNTPSFLDSRLVMPLSNDLISWPRNGDFSTPYTDVSVNYFTRDNVEGTFTASAGSPYDMNNTGATDADYEPNGATRTLINGVGTWYSGADGHGSEATPAMPVSAMSQVVAQYLYIDDTGDGGNSGIAIASPYEGEAKVYEWDDTTSSLVLKYTVPLTRSGVTITSKEDQKHPAAGGVANEASMITLVGDLKPGVIIADVPITVVIQNGTQGQGPANTLRSQNGTTTTGIQNDDDETLSLGWTPATLKAEITEGADNILYKRVITGGTESWDEA